MLSEKFTQHPYARRAIRTSATQAIERAFFFLIGTDLASLSSEATGVTIEFAISFRGGIMKAKAWVFGAAATGMALFAGSSAAALINAGFETGNLTGWTATLNGGSATVVMSNSTTYLTPATYLPEDGAYFLAVQSGNADVWQQVTQSVSLAAGETIGGRAAFDWGDYLSDLASPEFFQDGAKVEILDAAGAVVSTPFYLDGSLICTAAACPPSVAPSGFNGPWTDWSFTATAAGTYTVVYAARNTGDSGGPNQTFGYFDAASSSVPEPTTIGLLGIALAGLAFSRKRKPFRR